MIKVGVNKVTSQRVNESKNNKNNVSFGNCSAVMAVLASPSVTKGLQVLQENPAVNAAILDGGTMAAPRVMVESTQNPDYGIESAFREVAPMALNPFGPYFVGTAMLAFAGFKGLSLGKPAIEGLHQAWNDAGGANFSKNQPQRQIVQDYAKTVLRSTTGFMSTNGNDNTFKPLTDENIKSISKRLSDVILGNHDRKTTKKLLNEARQEFITATGVENSLEVNVGNKSFSTDTKTLFGDITSIGKKLFTAVNPEELTERVSKLSNISAKRTVCGATISIAGLCFLPFINNYMTKLRTGSDGYAAYKDFGQKPCTDAKCESSRKKEKAKLWGLKALSATGMFTIMAASMGGFGKGGFFRAGGMKKGFKVFMDKIQMKEKQAGMDLIRFMYGSSLISRILFSRDDQEVKVTTVRDYAGFLNWLVLGPFVAKGIAHLADKKGSLLNINGHVKEGNNKLKWASNWLKNVSLKSHGEIEAMAKKLPKAQALRTKIVFNASIIGGILYSGITLGLGMPILTNEMTNKAREKQLKENNQNGKLNLTTASVNFSKENKVLFDKFMHV